MLVCTSVLSPVLCFTETLRYDATRLSSCIGRKHPSNKLLHDLDFSKADMKRSGLEYPYIRVAYVSQQQNIMNYSNPLSPQRLHPLKKKTRKLFPLETSQMNLGETSKISRDIRSKSPQPTQPPPALPPIFILRRYDVNSATKRRLVDI